MKTLVMFIGLVSVATCWGLQPVQDTPEVAAAKVAHLAAVAKAKQEARDTSKPGNQQTWNVEGNTIKQESWKNQWAGNTAQDQRNKVIDTAQKNDGSWEDDGSWQNYDDGSWREPEATEAPNVENKWASTREPGKWTGPIALSPGYDEAGAPLPVEDTPEVAAAKAEHLQAYIRATAKSTPAVQAIPVVPQWPTAAPALQNSIVRPGLPTNKPLLRPALPPLPQATRVVPPTAAPLHAALQNSIVRPGLTTNKPLLRPALPPLFLATRVVPKEPAPIYENDSIDGVDTPEVTAAKAAYFSAHAKQLLQ